jgi:beta-galactosidase
MKHFLLLLTLMCTFAFQAQGFEKWNDGWKFSRGKGDSLAIIQPGFEDQSWESVLIPHTARLEPLVVNDQWQGICWYRKSFPTTREMTGKKVFLRFDGAMNIADVWVNGKHRIRHMGGFLPFVIDLSSVLLPSGNNVVVVRLDNTDNATTGPKPLKTLDFNTYGGIYRNVWLGIREPVYITDPVAANIPAGGGLFISTSEVSQISAQLTVKAHVMNALPDAASVTVRHTLLDARGRKSGASEISLNALAAGHNQHLTTTFTVMQPNLWSPRSPYLYTLRTELYANGRKVETQENRVGIRTFTISRDGLILNGERTFLRGVNRHQEYPYIGYALSDEAQYRDAVKIKEAGFDYVRLSHYPQAPAFMDACDELGLFVLDAIPGWQYFGNAAFQEYSLQTCRDMIRRDRNHPCVLAWEVSLNESRMTNAFMDKAHAIAREEYPYQPCYTAGWTDYAYDLYIQARQHRIGKPLTATPKGYMVSEYGDWEYYAGNGGLNQDQWKDLKQEDRSSRQLRGFGEIRLLQQATNVQEAHNENLTTRAYGDAYWVMYDYNRGYADDLESSGIMDIFRLPKFAWHFFRSQRNADERYPEVSTGPMVYIANYWTPESPTDVRVFSNCPEVELSLNGTVIARQKPDKNAISGNLAHAPFTFKVPAFVAGTLKATAYEGIIPMATYRVRTPGAPSALRLLYDYSGKALQAGGTDVVFVYAQVVDADGTIVPTATHQVTFTVNGGASLIGTPVKAEAGIASVLLRSGMNGGAVTVRASAPGLSSDQLRIYVKR